MRDAVTCNLSSSPPLRTRCISSCYLRTCDGLFRGSSGLVTEGAAQERGEEVLGLMQRILLHGTHFVYSFRHFQESLLVAQVWHWDAHLANSVEVRPRFCWSILDAGDLSLSAGV
jgi:hypothetical protein